MTHEEKLERITSFLKERVGNAPLRFSKRSVSHKVPKPAPRSGGAQSLDISDLDQLISIDEKAMICVAEPGLTFEALVRETLKVGLAPATVPELKTITVGGAVAGCSVESMSFKYGGFHDSCLEYEVVTAQGDVLTCSRENEQALLFEMLHGTFGTLGLITKLAFRLLPAKNFVHLVFEKHGSLADSLLAVEKHAEKGDADFIDGLVLGPRDYVLCLGRFVDQAPYAHSYSWMGVYHKAAASREEDYLSTYDYFFRYDADCHWISRNYGLENPVLRFLFGKLILSSTRMLSLAKSLSFLLARGKPDVVVDVFVPFDKVGDFLDFYNREFSYYPLWMVPYRMPRPYPWLAESYMPRDPAKLYLDLAIYGYRPKDDRNYYRLVEEKLKEVKGIKTLISHNFYSREEFWAIWNRPNYDLVKRETDPDNIFRDLYDKTL